MCGKRAACCPWVTRSTDEVSRVPGRFCPDPWRWPPWPLVQSSCLSLELSPGPGFLHSALCPAGRWGHTGLVGSSRLLCGPPQKALPFTHSSVDGHSDCLQFNFAIYEKCHCACLSMSRNVLPPDCSPESVPAPRAQGHWALRCCPAHSARGCHGAPVTGGDAHVRAICPSSSPASKPLTLSLCFPWRRPALPALICVFLMASDVDHIFMCVSLTVFSSPHF